MTYLSRIPTLLVLAAATTALFAGRVEAQGTLSPALWQESISLEVTTLTQNSTSYEGSDANVPEPHTANLSGTGYDVSGSVVFGSAEPPVGTAQVTWDISEAGATLNLRSSVSINFQVRVVETATPPETVTEVPVHLLANGSVAVEQIFGSRATSFFRFQAVGTDVLIFENLDISGDPQGSDPPTDSFAFDETPMIPPGAITLISMMATASMNTVGTGGATEGSATGMVDPIIEIADTTIPGTTANYRDFFTIEFSEGYDAQTPVDPVSMGELKRRFGARR